VESSVVKVRHAALARVILIFYRLFLPSSPVQSGRPCLDFDFSLPGDTPRPCQSCWSTTDFGGALFDHDAFMTMKETAVFDKPFVKKSALIGTETLPKEFYEQMKIFSRRELPIFKTREEALAWLVEE